MLNQAHIRILHCDITTVADKWQGLDIYSSFWRVYINKCDGASVELPGRGIIPLKGETMYLIPAWVRFITHTSRPVEHYYIHFDLGGLNEHVMKEVFNTVIACRGKVRFEELMRIEQEARTPLSVTCKIQAMIFAKLSEVFDALPMESIQLLDKATNMQNRFSEVLNYIDNHLAEDLDNRILARVMHMGLSHFVRTFKSAVGRSPADYVLHQRISKAVQDMLFTSAKIDEIAEQSGFKNRFHFSRCFKRIMGQSPGAYRFAYQLQIAENKIRPATKE